MDRFGMRHVVMVALAASCSEGAGPTGGDTDTGDGDATLLTFTTSVVYDRDLKSAGDAASGLEGADALCARHAEAAGLAGTWRAWLSDTHADALDRIRGDGPWARTDGQTAFLNPTSLETVPAVPLNIDELGRQVPNECVWTNTRVGGRKAVDCTWDGALTDSGCAHENAVPGHPSVFVEVGSAWSVGNDWTADPVIGGASCRLYCFEGP